MRKGFLLASLLAVGLVIAAGCGSGGSASQPIPDRKDNVFRYPIVTKPTTMDPGLVQDGDTIDVIQQVYEGLVGWGEDNKPTAKLAESWEIKDGGKTYVFKIRKGVKFSNGREVTAEDFKWCLERNCDPQFPSTTAGTYLSDIVGVNERKTGKAPTIAGVTVLDKYSLQIRLDKPRPYFLGKLTYPVAFVFAKEAVQDPKKELTTVEQMIGTGGFKFETVKVDQVVTMVANADYWDGKPAIEKIERPVVGDPTTRVSLYRRGDIDLVMLERQDLAEIEKDDRLKPDLKFFDRPVLWYIGINCDLEPAFKDVRVRRALAMALDRDQIVNVILGGVNKRIDSILPPGVLGYREGVKGIPYDPEGARKLLADAGYPEGKGLPEMKIYFRNNRADIRIVAENAVTQWNNNLGLKVSAQDMEWGAYLAKHNKKEIPLYHMRWGADYLDAENFLSTLLATYGNENKVKYSNKKFDALCREADTILDEEKRKKLYAEAEDLVIQEAPFIPIYVQRDAELIRPRVKGMRESVFGHLPHTKVKLN